MNQRVSHINPVGPLRRFYSPALLAAIVLGLAPAVAQTRTRTKAQNESTRPEFSIRVQSADAEGVRLLCTSGSPRRERLEIAGVTYPALTLSDTGHLVSAGLPILPRRRVLVEIPPDVDVTLVTTVLSEQTRTASALRPAPETSVNLETGERQGTSVPFASGALLPEVLARVEFVGWLRHRRVACIDVTPVRYEPATGVAQVASELRLELLFGSSRAGTGRAAVKVRDAGFFNPLYEQLLVNPGTYYAAARIPGAGTATSGPGTGSAASGPAVGGPSIPAISTRWRLKVEVNERGLYEVTHADLLAAGIDPTQVDPQLVGMSHAGWSVAVLVEGESDGSFDPADRVLFYAEPLETEYTRTNAWWVFETLSGPGSGENTVRRMATVDGTPQPQDVAVPFFRETVHIEEGLRYFQLKPIGPDDDHWMWKKFLAPATFDYPIDLPDPVAGSPSIQVRAALHGFTDTPEDPDHHTRILINGAQADDQTWNGIVPFLHDTAANGSLIQPGPNTIRVEQIADTGAVVDSVYSDWFEVDYDREFRVVADELAWNDGSNQLQTFAIEGLSVQSEYSLVVTDQFDVQRVLNVQLDNPGGGFRATFRHTPGVAERYFLATASAVRSPLSVGPGSARIRVPQQGADLLIIADSQYHSALAPLVQLRQQAGLRVTTIEPEQIYDSFAHGDFSPPAYRDFVRSAFESWPGPAPTFVLLVGEASLDYKDSLGFGAQNDAPGIMHQTLSQGTLPSEHLYVLAAGDDPLPDLFIGRLPAANPAELSLLVSKILAYETAPPPGAWETEVLHITDFGSDFINALDSAAGHIPGTHTVTEIYADVIGSASGTHSAIMAEFNQGAVVATYFGHGAIFNWGAGLLDGNDPGGMSNGTQLPLVTALNCLNGFFSLHSIQRCLGEEFVLSQSGGAVYCITTSGLAAVWELRVILVHLYDRLFAGESLGSVHTGAKLDAFLIEVVDEDNLWDMVLFGDPAAKFHL